jgi:hypothetical protein
MRVYGPAFLVFLGLMPLTRPTSAQTQDKPLDVAGIARVMGKSGELIGDMYKVSFPRSDLTVRVGNIAIKPALALVNWAAFMRSGTTAITYGDLVLLEEEVNPVISKLEEDGIELSALHNHLINEVPRILYIHFVGGGDEVALAKGIRDALGLTRTPLQSTPSTSETKPELAKTIERIIGYEGSMGGGVLHIVVPRNDIKVEALGTTLPGTMGMNTPLNFQLDVDNAAVNGDFMLRPAEVNPVLRELRANGIEIASLHNHMLDEQPKLLFMHFWAYGDAVSLAKGLKAALQHTGS